MKKIGALLIAVTIYGFLVAQPTLKYESHSLLPKADNPMTLCEYMEPGFQGENITWDFSNLKKTNSFIGKLTHFIPNENFNSANTQLDEFGTKFYFDITKEGMKQVGYASRDNNTIVRYTKAFEKMRFPFTYGDSYNTNFSGEYISRSKKIGNVDGTGFIEAESWGKLLLPNNTVYENTVRIKTTKRYTNEYSKTSSSTYEVITYRWYNEYHRYPLLVLTEYSVVSGSSEKRTNYQAAYNSDAVIEISSASNVSFVKHMLIYPNPVRGEIYLKLTAESEGPAYISVYDLSGRRIITEKNKHLVTGDNRLDLSNDLNSLQPGSYILKIRRNNKVHVKEFQVIK